MLRRWHWLTVAVPGHVTCSAIRNAKTESNCVVPATWSLPNGNSGLLSLDAALLRLVVSHLYSPLHFCQPNT